MTFGDKLREIRKAQGVTQKDVAARMGISYQAYGQYERAENIPKRVTLIRLADGLRVSLNELVDYEEG